MPRQLTERQAAGLWGDGGPYSEVRVTRQVRILDDRVSRTFHYVSAIINPTTFRLLKALRGQIQDFQILECLDRAAYQTRDGGYEWTVFGEESTSPAAANRVASELVHVITRMHGLVMEELGMTPPPSRGNA
jgi:hypothetical protein